MQRKNIIEKAERVKKTRELISTYNSIGIAKLHKVRAAQLQILKKKLEGKILFKVIKNKIFSRAIKNIDKKPNLKKIIEFLSGSNLFIFTDLNPFKLLLLLEKSKVKIFSKAGDIANEDIIIPKGNKGLPPGPVISQFSAVGVRTRIESGSVSVNKDTIVAKKGEKISENLAPLLTKLGIKPIESGLSLRLFYEDETFLFEDDLKLNIDSYKNNFLTGYTRALQFSITISYPTKENIGKLIQIASINAFNLGINAIIFSQDTISNLLTKAHFETQSLKSKMKKK